jgi:predicted kinase
MECKRLGDGGLGELVREMYRRKCGDDVHPRLLSFYGAYRACVRAKVGMLRRQQLQAQQQTGAPAAVYQYLAAADQYSADLGPACLLLVGGLMGTGKSTLALALADGLGAELESSDEIRRSLLGASPSTYNYGEGLYQPAMRKHVYDVMLDRARVFLQARLSVIMDATFMSRSVRQQAYALAMSNQARTVFVHCQCPESLAKSRIGARLRVASSHSEARPDLYEQQARDFEPPSCDEPAVTVDTSRQVSCQIEKVYAELRQWLFSEPADAISSSRAKR